MITVDTPAGFEWNEVNSTWVKNYLTPKIALLQKLTNGIGFDVQNITQLQFQQFCQLLESSAEGRELRNKMFKAWRSKKSRDSDNGKKLFTFNLSIKAGLALKKIAKQTPLNQTLEQLIFAGQLNGQHSDKQTNKIERLIAENKQLTAQLEKISAIDVSHQDHLDAIINNDLQVKALAELEKSQLIKHILALKRKLTQL